MVPKIVMDLREYEEMKGQIAWGDRMKYKLEQCYSVYPSHAGEPNISISKSKIEDLIRYFTEDELGPIEQIDWEE